MATVLKLGPADHGRAMTLEEYFASDYEEGYQYELIDGELYVSPLPKMRFARLERWLVRKLNQYAEEHPEVINEVENKARVFVSAKQSVTCPEPDIAAYHDFPHHLPYDDVDWEDVSPILVVEVLSVEDPDKDLVRNVELYLQVPSIREYWVLDHRQDREHPKLLVYRRRGQRWQRLITIEPGETYTTRLLPDFELVVDPRR